MSWFGERVFAPICEPTLRENVPVGQPCRHCREIFVPGDCGLRVNPGDYGEQLRRQLPGGRGSHLYHYACYVTLIVGGANHQRRLCRCYGGSQPPDPHGLTLREGAEMALKVWEDLHPNPRPSARVAA